MRQRRSLVGAREGHLFFLIVVYHLTRVIHIHNKAEENLGQTLSPKSSVSVTESTIGIAALSKGFLLLRQTLSSIPLTVSICPELTSATVSYTHLTLPTKA